MNKKNYSVVISCGGFGTRLKNVTNDIPKPLFPISGKSTFERCIEELSMYSIKNVLVTLGYKSEYFFFHITNIYFNLLTTPHSLKRSKGSSDNIIIFTC